MKENIVNNINDIQLELTDEMAQGTYVNMAIIAHSPSDFVIDFIRILPGLPKAKVMSRIILTPDNARSLLRALEDNIQKYDETVAGDLRNFIPPLGNMQGEA